MESGDEIFASPTSAAAAAAAAAPEFSTASYDVGEVDALGDAKRDLEEKLAAAERAAADAEGQAAGLRAEVKRVQDLLAAADSSDRDADGPGLGGVLATAHQEKLALEEEIKTLKASAAAAAEDKKEETAPPSTKDGLVASHGKLAAAAAVGAATTAAIAVVLLSLKRAPSASASVAMDDETLHGLRTLITVAAVVGVIGFAGVQALRYMFKKYFVVENLPEDWMRFNSGNFSD